MVLEQRSGSVEGNNLQESGCGAGACDRAAKGGVPVIGVVSAETVALISNSERVGAVYFGAATV